MEEEAIRLRSVARTILDDVLPVYHFRTVHTALIRATPDRVFDAIRRTKPSEIPFFYALFALRSMPALLAGRHRAAFDDTQPLFKQAMGGGFVQLGEVPEQELVMGTIGQFWKLWGGKRLTMSNAGAFVAFAEPGYAKAAMNFLLYAQLSDAVVVRTETRVFVPDPKIRQMFAVYWLAIYPGVALIRRMWLRAIRRRAEHR